MKVDLTYPKISDSNTGLLTKCIAFEKIDGTNTHWIWTLTDGWTHFGTRRTQFTLNREGINEFKWAHPELNHATDLFNETLRDKLTAFLCQSEYRDHKITVFAEFHGPHSFAGAHDMNDAMDGSQKLTLIDVAKEKRIIPPQQFIDDFSKFPSAQVIYIGKHIGQLVDDVHKGKYDDINEGVVCKGVVDGQVHMFKAKTKDWLKRVEKR